MNSRRLPGVLAEIAAVAGEAAAVQVAAAVGGTRAYVPAFANDDHWLVCAVGREKADLICAHFAGGGRGGEIEFPFGPAAGAYRQLRKVVARRIHELDNDPQMSEAKIARSTGVTGRTVRNHRRRHRGGGGDQDSLL